MRDLGLAPLSWPVGVLIHSQHLLHRKQIDDESSPPALGLAPDSMLRSEDRYSDGIHPRCVIHSAAVTVPFVYPVGRIEPLDPV